MKTGVIITLTLIGIGAIAGTAIWYFKVYEPKHAKVILNPAGEPVGPGWIDFNDQG